MPFFTSSHGILVKRGLAAAISTTTRRRTGTRPSSGSYYRCASSLVSSPLSLRPQSDPHVLPTKIATKIVPSTTKRNLATIAEEDEELFTERRLPVTIFNEEEELVRDSVKGWAQSELLPLVREMDDASSMDPKIIQSLFAQGFMGMEIPYQYGGSNLNFTCSNIVIEEISRIDPSVSIMVDIHNTLINNAILFWASEDIKERFLPKLAQDTVSSFCLSEAGSGTDAFSMKTTATLSEDKQHYILNGTKLWISNAKEAGILLVFANTDLSKGYKGITAFLLDLSEPMEGEVTIGKPENKLGLKASSTCPITFDNVHVPVENIVGEVGLGYKYCINILNEGRIGIASQQLGIAKGCLYDIALPYLNERKQFDILLKDFQGVQHQIGQLATEIYSLECMIYNTCRLKENNYNIIKEASMCKLLSSQVTEKVTSKSIELLGGIGFTKDILAEKFYRDCKVASIYEGTSNIQLQTIAKLLFK